MGEAFADLGDGFERQREYACIPSCASLKIKGRLLCQLVFSPQAEALCFRVANPADSKHVNPKPQPLNSKR